MIRIRETILRNPCVSVPLWSALFLVLVMSFGFTLPAYGMGGDIIWQLRDSKAGQQSPTAMAVDSQGNVIIAGYQNLNDGNSDKFYTIKISTSVNCGATTAPCVAWSSTFVSGASPAGADHINAMTVDSNNDVIVAGYVWNGNNNDCEVVKYSGSSGSQLWNYTYNGTANGNDYCTSVAVDSANNIYAGGYTKTSVEGDDFLVLKLSASGVLQSGWPVVYDGGYKGDDRLMSLALTSDGNVAATGYSWNGTNFDYLTAKFDTNGNNMWSERYPPAVTGSDNKPVVIKADNSDTTGKVVVTGYTSNATDHDITTVKYDGSGNQLWSHTYNGGFDDDPSSLWIDGSGDVYISGYSWTLAGNYQFYTARYNGSTGVPVWETVTGTSGDNNDYTVPMDISLDPAGDVLVTGFTFKSALGNYDWMTEKFSGSTGNLLWQAMFDGGTQHDDKPVGLAISSTGDLYVAGWSDAWTSGASDYDYYAIKYDRGLLNPPTGLTATAGVCTGDNSTTCVIDADCQTAGGTCSATSIKLRWADNSTNETNFSIERKLGDLGAYAVIATAPAGATAFTDTGLTANSYYYYRVRAYNTTIGYSNYSNEAHDLTKVISYSAPSWTYIYNGPRGCEGQPNITCSSDNDCAGTCTNSTCSNYPTQTCASDMDCNFGICSSGGDYASGIAVGPTDDNPIVTGYTTSRRGDLDYYTAKLSRVDASVQWSDTYNDLDDGQDAAMCIASDSQNNAIVSGYSSLWSTTTVCSGNTGQTCASDADCGSFAPCTPLGNTNHIYTIKYSASGPSAPGEGIWNVQYNSPFQIDDEAFAVASAVDGSDSIVVAGYGKNAPVTGNNDILVVKYLQDGTLDWSAVPYDGSGHGDDYPSATAFDPDGNVFVTGYVWNGVNYDYFTAKYCGSSSAPCGGKSKGQIIWYDVFDGGYGNDYTRSLAVDEKRCSNDFGRTCTANSDCSGGTCQANVYVTGYAVNSSGNEDWLTIKYDGSTGQRIWTSSYDGPAHGNDEAQAVRVDPIDGGVVVAGSSLTSAGNNDFHIIKYNPQDGRTDTTWVNPADGSQAGGWDQNFERPGYDDYVSDMKIDSTGYIYVAGDTKSGSSSGIMSLIYDYQGNFLGAMTYNGAGGYDSANAVAVNSQGEAFIAGYSMNASGNADYVVLKQVNSSGGSSEIFPPSPFSAVAQADYSKVNLSWGEKTSGTFFNICRTQGPYSQYSIWSPCYTTSAGAAAYTDTGLSANTNYCYQIAACIGTNCSRNVVTCVTTTLPAPVLSAPSGTDPSITDPTTQMYLSWSAVTGASSYTLQYKPAGGTYAPVPNCTGTTGTSCKVTGLSSGTQYYFEVEDLGPSGYSLQSNEVNGYTLPSAPAWNNSWSGTPFSSVTTNTITPNWNAVAGATSYALQYSPDNVNWGPAQGCGTNGVTAGISCAAGSLAPGTQYYFRVNSCDSSGCSAWSTVVNTYTLPNAPTLTSVTGSATCSNNTATITWSAPSGPVTGYNVQYSYCNDPNPNNCVSGNSWSGWQSVGNTTQTTSTFTMTPGVAYRFSVSSAVNNYGTFSSQSNVEYIWACLGTLTQNPITPLSNTSLMPNWTVITGATNYDVQRKTCTGSCSGGTCSGGTYNTITTVGAGVGSFTDTGLTQGTSYSYIIRAYNSAVAGSSASINDTFSSGINSTTWWQAGYLGAASATAPPINMSDGNGSAAITAPANAVEFDTTSNGNDTGTNQVQMGLNNLSPFASDFDSQVAYDLPGGQVTSYSSLQGMNYYVDFRMDFTADGNTRVAVQRHVDATGNGYTADIFVNGTSINTLSNNYVPTSDTSGILRISRAGSTVYVYVWTNGAWQLLAQASDATNLAVKPVKVYIFQNALRNNAISLKAQIDNFIATFPQATVSGLTSPPDVYSNSQCLATPPPAPDTVTAVASPTAQSITVNWCANPSSCGSQPSNAYTGYVIERAYNIFDDPAGDSVASNWSAYSTLATMGGNLLSDPSFENSPSNWTGMYSGPSSCAAAISSGVPPLSNAGGGSWTRSASLGIDSFQANYQTRLTVSYDPAMQSNFSDIRFYDATAGAELPYWIESYTAGSSAAVWIKTGPNNNIYMYYGNPNAASSSSGSNTFLFFDDFAGTTINTSKWSKTDTGGYISQNNGLIISNGTGTWGQTAMYSQQTFARSSLVAQAMYKTTLTTGSSYKDTTMLMWKDSSTGTSYTNFPYALYFDTTSTSGGALQVYENGTQENSNVGAFAANTQYWVRQILKASGGATYQRSTDGSAWTTLYDDTNLTTTPLTVGFTHYQGGTVYINNFIVRQYVSPEPTVVFCGGSIDSNKPDNGSVSLDLSSDGSASSLGRYNQTGISVSAGANYILSAYFNTNLSAGQAQCEAYSGATVIGGIQSTGNSNGWALQSATLTIPAGITSVNIRCYGSNSPSGTAYVDSLQFVAAANANVTSYTDTSGLIPGYGYKYRIKATYAAGDGSTQFTAYTNDANSYARTVPSAPLISNLTADSTSQITAKWNDVTGETGFKLYWKPMSGSDCTAGSWNTPIPQGQCSGSPCTAYSLTGLAESAYYCFCISAFNSTGESACSAPGSRETIASAPALNALSSITTTSMYLGWSHINNNAGYMIQRKTKSGGTYAQIGTTGANIENYPDSGLDPGQVYYYQVFTKNGEGNYSLASNAVYARTTPLAPTVSLSTTSPSQIILSWPEVYGASNYNILRSTSSGGTYTQIGGTSLTYQELYCNQTYPSAGCTTSSPMTTTFADGGSWNMYEPLTITNFLPNHLTRMTVPYNSNMKSDFSDIRFYDQTAGAELPYWIESEANGASATVWIMTGANNNIYMYYGNQNASSSSSVTNVFGTGLVGFWQFNEPAGTVSGSTADVSGNNNNLTLNGFSSPYGIVSSGRFGNALSLNGSSNYASETTTTNIPAGSVASVEAWIKPTGTYGDVSYNGIVSWGPRGCTGTSLLMGIENSGRPDMATWCNDFVPSSGTAATANQWNHIAVVLNGKNVTLYMNGQALSGTLSSAPNIQAENLSIGTTDFPGRYFNGLVDEVRIYNRALSASEIAARYAATDPAVSFGAQYTSSAVSFSNSNYTGNETGLTQGTNYCYEVVAYNSGLDSEAAPSANSAPSAPQCISTTDLAKPALSGSALNSRKIQVSWTYNPAVCSPNPCRSDIDGVEIEAQLTNGQWYLLTTTNASTSTIIDTVGINPATTYGYRARAFKVENGTTVRSQYSDTLNVTTPAYQTGDTPCY